MSKTVGQLLGNWEKIQKSIFCSCPLIPIVVY